MAFKIKHWIEMGVATVLAAGFIAVFPVIERELNRNKPIDEWFNVRQLEVAPITPVGSFPVVIFDRTVGQDFEADWAIELQTVAGDQFESVCRPVGTKTYKVGEELDNQGESITWFTERFPECAVIKNRLGKYRIVVTWVIDRGNSYYEYTLEKISNVFEIVDPDAFVPSKTQESINKTVKEVEAKVDALEEAPLTASGGANE